MNLLLLQPLRFYSLEICGTFGLRLQFTFSSRLEQPLLISTRIYLNKFKTALSLSGKNILLCTQAFKILSKSHAEIHSDDFSCRSLLQKKSQYQEANEMTLTTKFYFLLKYGSLVFKCPGVFSAGKLGKSFYLRVWLILSLHCG